MKTSLSLLLAALTVLTAAPSDVAISSPSQIADAAPKWFEQWLNQDVVYIISKEEGAAFLNLKNDKDRKDFIEQFWWRRNPDPESIENTFESEHYRRIAFANSHFGTKAKPGWQTERGHVYVVFGNPDFIEAHPADALDIRTSEGGRGLGTTFPFEVWHFKYLEGVGPDSIVEFEDPTGDGNYKLAAGDSFWRSANSGATATGPCIDCRTGISRGPRPKYRQLMEVLTAHIVRNQVPFEYKTKIQPVTDCTWLAMIAISVPMVDGSEPEKPDASRTGERSFEIFMRVLDISGRVMQSAEGALPPKSGPEENGLTNSAYALTKAFPLFAGQYRLQIAIKNVQTDQIGVQSFRLEIPPNPPRPH